MRANLYSCSNPESFNKSVIRWLRGEVQISNHSQPIAFRPYIYAYEDLKRKLNESRGKPPQREILNHLTDILLSVDLKKELSKRLSDETGSGFRSALSQGLAKNMGENFVDLIVYNLAEGLGNSGIVVDKGVPPLLKKEMEIEFTRFGQRLKIPIECDICIFDWGNPSKAIMINAKTRLKEIFHIGTMWKLIFDISKKKELMEEWGMEGEPRKLDDVLYCFATADLRVAGKERSQGPDIEVQDQRNLIKVDSSFFDFVFVSKPGPIRNVQDTIPRNIERKCFFHNLGAVYDLIEGHFKVEIASVKPHSN
jgi:hypothetical protein